MRARRRDVVVRQFVHFGAVQPAEDLGPGDDDRGPAERQQQEEGRVLPRLGPAAPTSEGRPSTDGHGDAHQSDRDPDRPPRRRHGGRRADRLAVASHGRVGARPAELRERVAGEPPDRSGQRRHGGHQRHDVDEDAEHDPPQLGAQPARPVGEVAETVAEPAHLGAARRVGGDECGGRVFGSPRVLESFAAPLDRRHPADQIRTARHGGEVARPVRAAAAGRGRRAPGARPARRTPADAAARARDPDDRLMAWQGRFRARRLVRHATILLSRTRLCLGTRSTRECGPV